MVPVRRRGKRQSRESTNFDRPTTKNDGKVFRRNEQNGASTLVRRLSGKAEGVIPEREATCRRYDVAIWRKLANRSGQGPQKETIALLFFISFSLRLFSEGFLLSGLRRGN